MVKKWLVLLFFICFTIFSMFSQSKHQRLGVEKERENVFIPELDISYGYSNYNGNDIYSFRTNLGLQYIYMSKFIVSSSIPVFIQIFKAEYSKYFVSFTNGDIDLLIGYITKITDYKLQFHIKYIYPLGIWNQYEVEEKRIKGGNGYHNINISMGVARIIDPVVLNGSISYSLDFPRKERFGWSMNPGKFIFSFNYTEVLNDEIGIRIGMDNFINLPYVVTGKFDNEGIQYQLSINFSILYNNRDTNLQFGISKISTDIVSNPSINFNIGHDFYF